MAPKAARARLDARRAAAAAFTSSQTPFSFEIRTLSKLHPAGLGLRRLASSRSGTYPEGPGRIRSVRGSLHKFQASSSVGDALPQNDTLLDKMVLSAPAEPIFLVGVALGVLIAGAIFAINMRRWRAQQRLR